MIDSSALPTIASMRILIANDDGYLAPGLAALVQAMQGLGEIDVIAPEQNASGTSNALTLNRPLSVYRAGNGFQYVNGTPSDCVHVALTGLLPQRPGPGALRHQQRRQHGRRHAVLGHRGRGDGRLSVRHPGDRVLAGREGLGPSRCRGAGGARRGRAGAGAATRAERPWLLNVNIPNRPMRLSLPRQVTRLGRRHASEPVIKQTSPRGETIYWIGPAGDAREAGEGTDFHATASGCVSITPLQVDLTDHAALASWRASLGLPAGR